MKARRFYDLDFHRPHCILQHTAHTVPRRKERAFGKAVLAISKPAGGSQQLDARAARAGVVDVQLQVMGKCLHTLFSRVLAQDAFKAVYFWSWPVVLEVTRMQAQGARTCLIHVCFRVMRD